MRMEDFLKKIGIEKTSNPCDLFIRENYLCIITLIIIIIFLLFLAFGCTFRQYRIVNLVEENATLNQTITITAEVPKHIEAEGSGTLDIPGLPIKSDLYMLPYKGEEL